MASPPSQHHIVAKARADDGITTQIKNQSGAADTQITTIFGGSADQRLERTVSAGRVVDALSSEEAFAAATLANGPDKLDGFNNRNTSQARNAFNQLKSTATAHLGSLGSTRFGTAVFNVTPKAQSGCGDAEKALASA